MDNLQVYLGRGGEYTFLPYHLPAGRVGRCEVTRETYKKGRTVTIVSWRNAVFMGLQAAKTKLDRDVVVHSLIENDRNGDPDRLWMTSKPQEIEQATRQLAKASGRVLVGGLGLGLATIILSENPKVKSITVVEKNHDVVKLVWEHMPVAKAWLVEDDLYAYLEKCRRKKRVTFDFAFYDTWTQTGQHAHVKYVLPLRRLSVGIVPQSKLECWNEDEMLGQSRLSLESRIAVEYGFLGEPRFKWDLPKMSNKDFLELREAQPDLWPFYNWMRQVKPTLSEAQAEVDYYMAACKDGERWENKWSYYEQI